VLQKGRVSLLGQWRGDREEDKKHRSPFLCHVSEYTHCPHIMLTEIDFLLHEMHSQREKKKE